MIHSIKSRFNLIASYEDAALDWKAANSKAYWAKVFHLEMDLEDFFLPQIGLIGNNVMRDVG